MTTSQPAAAPASSPERYKILVAVAFDATGDQALLEGFRLAASEPSSELHIVHAVTSFQAGIAAMQETDLQLERAPQLLRERVEHAWKQTRELRAIAHIRPGEAADVILQVAVDVDADLLVIGSHRRTGLQRLVLGSVAERVLHLAHCPVLLALPKDYAADVRSPAVEPACEQCLAVRKETANARFWCQRHAKPYLHPHVYVPRGEERAGVYPTF